MTEDPYTVQHMFDDMYTFSIFYEEDMLPILLKRFEMFAQAKQHIPSAHIIAYFQKADGLM